MRFRDRVWCWLNRICTKHLVNKNFGSYQGCPECAKEAAEQFEALRTALRKVKP